MSTLREAAAPAAVGVRPARVSWSHALPLAVVLAFANGFWIISLRGAVGAIERTSAPFAAWWRESALLVPVYVVAVLAAFLLAQRWFGPRPRGVRALVGSGALVAGAAALTGTTLLGVSSWFDFRLQRADLHHMSVAHPGCDAVCTAARVQATADLLVKSIWVGLVLMVLTDLVLVGLVIAFRGGRLVLARPSGAAPRAGHPTGTAWVLAAGLAGAAAIHTAVIREHVAEWWAAAVFFVLLALAEVLAAALVLARDRAWRRAGLWSAVVVSLGPLLVWSVSRAWGLPFGPEAGEPEAVGVADVLSCALEVMTLVVAVLLLRRERRTGDADGWTPHGLAIALTGVLAVTLIGIGGSSLPVVGAFSDLGSHHGGHEELSG